ncbi:MAG: Serine/threonine protein kinase PrkC, regulator of stationary phase [Myxococcales bacterium]|nr:Serine/threonine protein kinase PrkC, regulator of stationary phase [Myxococcales bacterium]
MVDDRNSSDETVQQPAGSAPTVAAPSNTPGLDATLAAGSAAGIAEVATPPLGMRSAGGATLTVLDSSRYTLGSLLGQGGMGEVVLAFDEQIGREVAVKRIRSGSPSGEELSRFVREARVQGRLQHPAVVPVHDLAFDKDGKPYFVMKRLSGTTVGELLAKLRAGGDIDVAATRRRLLRAFADVCLAIEFAHSAGIIHRDLKPANVMLGDFGEVYVLDWGVARAVTEADDSGAIKPKDLGLELDSGETRAGTVLGTPAYMAPEQLAGERAGPAADIYALGCMLYEIACGEVLHGGRRSLTAILKPLDARPSRIRPDSPPELDAICEHATRLDPAERFSSARALGNAVQAFLDGDRDLAVRRELAVHHIAVAHAALARGDDPSSRRDAMQAAGRALALDPTAAEAGELVTRLMLEPPTETPPEVETEIVRQDHATARMQGRLAASSMIGYLAFIPLLIWTGVRSYELVAAFAALAAASGIQVWVLSNSDHISRRGIYLNACINAVLIGLVCRMVGPFIIAPTLVTTTLIAYAAHPALGSIRIVAVILSSGVLIPWALEVLGVLQSTYRFVDGELILSSPVLTFSEVPVQAAFAVLLVALVVVVALLTRGMALRQRRARRALELQTWHLRQILPTHSPR